MNKMPHKPQSSKSSSGKENIDNVILVEPSQVSQKKLEDSSLPKFYDQAKYQDTFSNLLQLPQPSRPKFKPWNNATNESNAEHKENYHYQDQMQQGLYKMSLLKGPAHMSAGRSGTGHLSKDQVDSPPKQIYSMSEEKTLSISKELVEHCHVQYQEWRERQIHYTKKSEELGLNPVKIDLDCPWDPNAIA